MMYTRSQARREQSSRMVASPGVNSPRRHTYSLQGNADVIEASIDYTNDPGGSQAEIAAGNGIVEITGNGISNNSRKTTKNGQKKMPSKCNRKTNKKCETCCIFNEENFAKSTVTGRKYDIKNRSQKDINCKSDNIIYLIECDYCHIQYVGETSQKMSERFSDHKSRIRKHDTTKQDTLLIDHFNNGTCKGKTYNAKIIEIVDGNARKDGKIDPAMTTQRRKIEDKWMEKMHTIYPYGLNNRYGKNKDQRDDGEPVRTVFNTKRKNRNRKRRFRRKYASKLYTTEEAYTEITKDCEDDIGNEKVLNESIRIAQKKIPQMRKKDIKELGNRAMEDLVKDGNVIPRRLLHIIIDLTLAKLHKSPEKVKKQEKKTFGNTMTVTYVNHCIDKLNVSKMLNDKKVLETIPNSIKDKEPPTVIFKYMPTIRKHMFNYKETVNDFKHNDDLKNMQCSCSESTFIDKDHGHVITGDLMIIKNKKLRQLFQKGPNHREKQTMNWKKAQETLREDLKRYIEKWSKKESKPLSYFAEWKNAVLKMIEENTKRLKKVTRSKPVKQVLKDTNCKKELEELKKEYVIVPIDKASNNIGLVCKKYYLEVLIKETQTDTYQTCQKEVGEIVDTLVKKSNDMNIKVEEDQKDLPIIYGSIKMHKKPVKFRYIVASKQCATKNVAKKLTKALQLISKVHKKYCDKIRFLTGIERYWIADNNEKVLNNIDKISKKNTARNVQTFDFATLYTKITLEDLKDKLKQVVAKAFKGGQCKYINLTQYDAKWTKNNTKNTVTKEKIFAMIDYIVDNAYFRFGDKVLLQIIGLPMGIDPAPVMANLYLYFYEFQFMEKMRKENYGVAIKFNLTDRFIDDLIALNNDGYFAKYKDIIYPKELKLNKENDSDDKATFLDIEIEKEEKVFITRTYDKRDAFPFAIVNYPDLGGNIPPRPAYGVFISQIIRYSRTCSETQDLKLRLEDLIKKLKNKHFTEDGLKYSMKKCLLRNPWIRKKHRIDERIVDFDKYTTH